MQTKQAFPPPAGAVPFSGSYTDLTNKPTLGDAAAASVAALTTSIRQIPQNPQTASYALVAGDAGKHVSITTGGVTLNAGVFAVGDAVTIFNNSGSSQTITAGAGVTLYQAGTSNTGNRTLAQRGVATVLCVGTNIFVISGAGLS